MSIEHRFQVRREGASLFLDVTTNARNGARLAVALVHDRRSRRTGHGRFQIRQHDDIELEPL